MESEKLMARLVQQHEQARLQQVKLMGALEVLEAEHSFNRQEYVKQLQQ